MKKTPALPRRCACGGKMLYAHSLGLTFSCCNRCTPIVTMRPSRATRQKDRRE